VYVVVNVKMHIKTITIQGFKSYRDQTAIEEFSPGHNVVVGRNGSGKSNFFAAIRFVLSDAYTSLSKEERQALLHDSSSSSTSTTLSAFVEIVFDNSDGRFPSSTGTGDLVIRRAVGLKKDEYSIDRKSASKSDVMNLLEAAGFSRSNPYYIVPQGRITRLTNMKDNDRLNLLKDVAGTKVYETRRADSLRIMEETQSKKDKIRETLTYIQERLNELDEERQELREFHDKDKDRRTLEYTMHHRDSQDLASRLDELDARRREELNASDDKQKHFFDREKLLKTLEDDLATLQHRQAMQKAERDSLLQDRRELARAKAEIEALINDDDERTERVEGNREELEGRLESVNKSISTVEGELMGLIPTWEESVARLNEARNTLESTKARIQILFARKGRSSQYRTQHERDVDLRQELDRLRAFEETQGARQVELQAESNAVRSEITETEAALTEKSAELEQRRSFIEQSAQRWDELKTQEEELLERKKALWKEEHKLGSTSAVAQEKLTTAQRQLSGMMDRATASGLANVEALADRLGLTGVFGPLYKLFTVNDMYKIAVEATAGQSLFHVVVDTDDTAGRLIEAMNAEKLGRVTFMPLNRLQPKPLEFQERTDALIMLKKLSYDPKYKKAFQQVFGRTIICPSLTVAASYVQSSGVNGITLDGDKVERKGALSGGYNDPKRSRLDAIRDLKRWQEIFDKDNGRLTELRAELKTLDEQINASNNDRQLLETRSKRANRSRESLMEEVRALREAELTLRRQLQKLQERQAQMTRELQTIEAKRAALDEELANPLNAGLSEGENVELDTLNGQADVQEKAVMEIVSSVTDLNTRKETLEIELDDNLKRERSVLVNHLDKLRDRIVGESQADGEAIAASVSVGGDNKKRLQIVRAQMADRQRRLEAIETDIEGLHQRISEKQERFDTTTREQVEEAREITRHEKVLTKVLAKRREAEKRKAEVDQKIRELGIVPSDALAKYADDSTSRVLKRLHKVQASLRKFSNVNRRAIEQYDNFAKQRDQLLEREEDLRKSSDSITELIESLDMRKDEAIERTFKQVSKNFADVFERLVPMGRGSLIMQRRVDSDSQEDGEADAMDEDQDSVVTGKNVENYTGVTIKVSFHSKEDEGLLINQLSGGQKSLVALALIFAIQRCDPAAFYLFDEIDANLDAQYRTAVAAMIKEQSANAQFIVTTFRPELVATADKHYGVFFSAQKVSSLRPITQDDALTFVEAASEGVRQAA
jgi:structural maintenance of chromosome 3 (chondroitin sulfate proteoglycan 6)